MKSNYFNTLLLVCALTIGFIFSGKAQNSTEPAPAVTTNQTLQTIKLKVAGVTCSGDIKDIQGEVSKLDGVTACVAKGKASATSTFEVTFNPAIISEKEIRSKVEDTPGCTDPNDRPYKVKKG